MPTKKDPLSNEALLTLKSQIDTYLAQDDKHSLEQEGLQNISASVAQLVEARRILGLLTEGRNTTKGK